MDASIGQTPAHELAAMCAVLGLAPGAMRFICPDGERVSTIAGDARAKVSLIREAMHREPPMAQILVEPSVADDARGWLASADYTTGDADRLIDEALVLLDGDEAEPRIGAARCADCYRRRAGERCRVVA